MKPKKKYKIVIILLVSLQILWIIFINVIFISSTTVCGRVIGQEYVRGGKCYIVSYGVNGKKMLSKAGSDSFKIKGLDQLKKEPCIEIEYSNFFPKFIRGIK